MKAEKKYLSGMSFDNGAVRKHSLTVLEGPLKDTIIFQETWTPKNKHGEWGTGTSSFYVEGGKTFKSIEELIKALEG